jgi:hypothetical protein
MKNVISSLVIAGLVLALAPAAQAEIIGNVTATASSYYNAGGSPFDPDPAKAVNGTGMTGQGATGTHTGNEEQDGWQASQTTSNNPWIIVDLGVAGAVELMYVWNGQSEGQWNQGIKTANIYSATTDPNSNIPNSGAAFNTTGWDLWGGGDTAFAKKPGDNDAYGKTDTIELGLTNVRYIALAITETHGGLLINTSINELQFDTVPEPATMSLLAIGGLALLRRRKRA